MISVLLQDNNYMHNWYKKANIYVIGCAFLNSKILKNETLADYFSNIKNEETLQQKLQKLDGHFSVIIELEHQYLLAVDHIRTFPIFIQQTPNDVCISNSVDIKNCSWNRRQEAYLRTIYCTIENETLLNEWKQLQAGEIATINKQNQEIKFKKYFIHSEEKKISNTNAIKHFEEKLINHIKQYVGTKKILIPLSGGYDSRYLLALLIENGINNITCFTYGRKDSYEVKTAQRVCQTLNINWHFIEYTDDLLNTFFSEKWEKYSNISHNFSALPHEQDFFALLYLQQQNLLPKDAIVLNGFCQDLHAGSIFKPLSFFNLSNYIQQEYKIQIDAQLFENSWDGFQQWFVQNRVSKFIIHSVHVYEYFGLDFYLPFWQKDWIQFWYALSFQKRLNQQYYNEYLFNGIFKKYKIDFKKPTHDSTNSFYSIKRWAKDRLPNAFVQFIQQQNATNINKDVNNSLYLYNAIYERLNIQPTERNFKINDIHSLYLLQKIKENCSSINSQQ
ncbi:MAG: asparagine synthase-related protein [Chitinophagales bacterium]